MGASQPLDAAETGLRVMRVDQLIEQQPLSRLQVITIVLCSVTTIVDGFDAQAIGFLASPLADHFHVDVRSFGQTFAMGLLGIMAGALLMGPAGDRWGRKKALIASVLVVGVCCLATVFAHSMGELTLLRFLTGLGLGGAMPNTIAMLTEYTPSRLRHFAICLSAASIPTGGMLSGLVASMLLPVWGWQSMFVVGGIMPLLVAAGLMIMLPESLRFLSLDSANQGRIRSIIRRMWPAAAIDDAAFLAPRERPARIPMSELFSEGRTAVTLALWTAYFMNLMVLYVVVSWLPAMLRTEGLPVSTGILAITTFSFGGIAGSLSQAPLMGRIRPHLLIAAEFAIFIGLVEYLAHSDITPLSVGVVAFAIGWVIQGAQAGLNVFTATFYPTSARATGIGWGLGVGRIGSVCGPLLGGAALMAGWSARQILTVGAVPAIVAACAVLFASTYAMTRVSHGVTAVSAGAPGPVSTPDQSAPSIYEPEGKTFV
jgi:AAHS family 4-hydroxybenzoate transporter-like MFS transporter